MDAFSGAEQGVSLPDVMNDPAFAPPQRRGTFSSTAGSDRIETCRICRSEGSPSEPLFHPCKCSGSIKFVHQECLMDWLSHSHKKHCELCKTPFRFTKLYDANMPSELPWAVFAKRACMHALHGVLSGARMLVVAVVWLIVVPWSLRWAWRWMFWTADAAWARENFMNLIQKRIHQNAQRNSTDSSLLGSSFEKLLDVDFIFNATGEPFAYTFANALARNLGIAGTVGNGTAADTALFKWPQADPSILSSFSYLSSLTSSEHANRFLLDVFEGQLITCVVIVGFILVFLIREWVVQQQPLVNLDVMNHAQNIVQQRAHEAQNLVEQRAQEQLGSFAEQQALLDQAYVRFWNRPTNSGELPPQQTGAHFTDLQLPLWNAVEPLIDHGTGHLRDTNDPDRYEHFVSCVAAVQSHIRAARASGTDLSELPSKLFEKLSLLSSDERLWWWTALFFRGKFIHATSFAIDQQWTRELIGRSLELSPVYDGQSSVANASSNAGTFHQDRHQDSGTLFDGQDQSTTMETRELASSDHIPIANAGPDTKVNIKKIGRGRPTVPPPREKTDSEIAEGANTRGEANSPQVNLGAPDEDASSSMSNSRPAVEPAVQQNRESQHNRQQDNVQTWVEALEQRNRADMDGPVTPGRPEEPRHEGTGEAYGPQTNVPLPAPANDTQHIDNETPDHAEHNVEQEPHQHRPEHGIARFNILGKMADWFWGDIDMTNAEQEGPLPADERRMPADGEPHPLEPFVAVQDAPVAEVPLPAPEPAAVPPPPPVAEEEHFRDPEVVAAAAQAGLDPEAFDDAEDLEGMLELIGLQGPIIGLFQTSAFCTLLVAATMLCAVVFPYIGGKVVLSFVGSPVWFCFKAPLQLASSVADVTIDIAILAGGWAVILGALAYEFLSSALETMAPTLPVLQNGYGDKVIDYATHTASKSAERLANHFVPVSYGGNAVGWSWMLLAASAHSHASLRDLKGEIDAVFTYTGVGISTVVDMISSGTVLKGIYGAALEIGALLRQISFDRDAWLQYVQPLQCLFADLRRGALTFETAPSAPLDPTLVFWNSADRSFAVLAGYLTLAALAAVYVAADTPIMRSEANRRHEKVVRDTLKQAGGVLKVILIISIEMLVFPLYCGLLLDLAFLPLFKDANISARWGFAVAKPYTFCFVHWFIGTCYMFHFALFVGMCRKILRKGVLWFIRDPDDPTFHPVRDVLERGVMTQLRKIAFSGLVYGALVILCLGGVIWTIGQVCHGIFPVYWVSTEPYLEFPMDLILYNLITPMAIRFLRPSDAVHNMYAWWLRRCARFLRLSHFLFDDRRRDEEGHYLGQSWDMLINTPGAVSNETLVTQMQPQSEDPSDNQFTRDGKFVLTPCNDQYRPPKPGEAFLQCDEDDVYIVDRDGKKNDHFAKIYVPPFFRVRVTLFMVCLWMFSAVMGLCATLLPLVLGRHVLSFIVLQNTRVNDLYAYSIGASILASVATLLMTIQKTAAVFAQQTRAIDFSVWLARGRSFMVKLLKCAYLYGFAGLILPFAITFSLHLYLLVPLKTWVTLTSSAAASSHADQFNTTAMASPLVNATQPVESSIIAGMPGMSRPTIHLLSDYALGILYVRICMRSTFLSPGSRAAGAIRRITANGYFDPDIRLATRYFILPSTLLATIVVALPPLAMVSVLYLARQFGVGVASLETWAVLLFRSSYPVAAFFFTFLYGAYELMNATARWRARIRDEVYLVGERLHNFGEKRPPVGTRTVVRRDR